MIHPIMMLLGQINVQTFDYSDNIDLSFLPQEYERVIRQKTMELCNKLLDKQDISSSKIPNSLTLLNTIDDDIDILFDMTGVASTLQAVNRKQYEISQETALILTRLRAASLAYIKKLSDAETFDDISSDIVLTKLEAMPQSVYSLVYDILSNETASLRNAKVGLTKLNELRNRILLYQDKEAVFSNEQVKQKLSTISTLGFWRTLIYHDYMNIYNKPPNEITVSTLQRIHDELNILGIPGFVPPNIVFESYANTMVQRKVNVMIQQSVIEFLTKVVKSGGVVI